MKAASGRMVFILDVRCSLLPVFLYNTRDSEVNSARRVAVKRITAKHYLLTPVWEGIPLKSFLGCYSALFSERECPVLVSVPHKQAMLDRQTGGKWRCYIFFDPSVAF